MSVFLQDNETDVRIIYLGRDEKTFGYRDGERWQIMRRPEDDPTRWYHSATLTVPGHVSAQDVLRLAVALNAGPSTEET